MSNAALHTAASTQQRKKKDKTCKKKKKSIVDVKHKMVPTNVELLT